MVIRDLCNDKKFPDLEDDFHVITDKKKKLSFIDEKNNVWMEDKKISEGAYGKVVNFISHNKEYVDLAVKFFIADDTEDLMLSMREETEVVNLFNLYKCDNFLNTGVKELSNDNVIIIMEKIDGDMTNFDFSNYQEPIKIFEKLVKFLVSGFKCALKRDRYFIDIKEENIGFKMCSDGPVFTFLDFGSFFDRNYANPISTYNINDNANKNNFFSNEMIFVFGTIITLLSLRLLTQNKNKSNKFSRFVYQLSEEEDYPDTDLLNEEYYYLIRNFFDNLFREEDEFIEILFQCLYELTIVEPDVSRFLNTIDYYR